MFIISHKKWFLMNAGAQVETQKAEQEENKAKQRASTTCAGPEATIGQALLRRLAKAQRPNQGA